MNDFFGVTDNNWFMILSHKPEISEINFYVMWRLGYNHFTQTCDFKILSEKVEDRL
jgi:hypothetical protein